MLVQEVEGGISNGMGNMINIESVARIGRIAWNRITLQRDPQILGNRRESRAIRRRIRT